MIAVIAAFSKNRVIGNHGRIPWKIPGEQQRFKALTTGHVVIMGRNTYEEIGYPLPNRETIVLSSTLRITEPNCAVVPSLQEALQLAGTRDVFIAGGERLYAETIPFADVLYITEVEAEVEGDRYFPDFPKDVFQLEQSEYVPGEVPYIYQTYRRKPLPFEKIQVRLKEIQSQSGIVLGLDTMRNFMAWIGNPQNQTKFIHIAGTNGKGSTGMMLASILREAGYRVGHYTSPAVFHPLEPWCINGASISEEEYCTWFTRLLSLRAELSRQGCALPTAFELETAVAFCWFAEKQCDYVVLECGMGGVDDATNLITTTVLSVLTSIGLEHTKFLGNTLAQIASVKAGILRPNTPAVLEGQGEEVETVIQAACEASHSPLVITKPSEIRFQKEKDGKTLLSYGAFQGYFPLQGKYQGANAAAVLEAVEVLRKQGIQISAQAVKNGLADVRCPGRMEQIAEAPLVFLDGAHNPDAAEKLQIVIRELMAVHADADLYLVMGVLADKDYHAIAALLAPLAVKIFTVTPNHPRALSAEALAACIRSYHSDVTAMTISEAVDTIFSSVKATDLVLVFGSLSYLGAFRESFQKRKGVLHGARASNRAAQGVSDGISSN